MVAYSFFPRFFEPIRQGIKTQTIRANGLRRHARPGELLQLYTGMRTVHCKLIIPATPCLDVMKIMIVFATGIRDGLPVIGKIRTDGINVRDLDAFAIRDGFADIEDMSAFWRENHPETVREGFCGVLIEWARPAETELAVAA